MNIIEGSSVYQLVKKANSLFNKSELVINDGYYKSVGSLTLLLHSEKNGFNLDYKYGTISILMIN